MDLDEALLGLDNMPSSLTKEEKEHKESKALSQIHLHLLNQILQDVLKEKIADALWLKLEELCMTKSLTSKFHLKPRLYSHRMVEGTSLEENLMTFKEIVANLDTLEIKYEEEDLGLMLLCSLPNSYATFRDTILYNRDTLTLNEVYEMKQLIVGPKVHGYSLFVYGRSQEKNSSEEQRKRSKSRNSNQIYNYCKKNGHIKKKCFKLQNKEKKFGNKQGEKSRKSGEASVVELDQTDEELLVASDTDLRAGDWILDSGCTFHMTPNRDWFSTYKLLHKYAVLMGNNASCKLLGIGIVHIKMFDGVVCPLGDVKHVLDLKRNLISLSTIDAKGYKYW